MPSNLASPDFATPGGRNTAAGVALAAALLLHAILLWILFQETVRVINRPPVFNIELVHLPKPVPAVKPQVSVPKPKPKPVPRKIIVHVKPVPLKHVIAHSAERHAVRHLPPPPPKIMHFNAANANTGLGLGLNAPNAGTGLGSIGNFDDAVNARIAAMTNYPPGLPPSHGLKFWNACVISYRLTIAANGALISYKLWGCDNPYLDSATRADILLAAPYPVPPNFGGTEYDVYGSKVYNKRPW